MLVFYARRVPPGMENVIDDGIDSDVVFDLSEHERADASHLFRVPFHHRQVGSDGLSQVCFVDHEEIALSDAWPSLARNLVAPRHVDHLDRVVRQLPTEARGEIVSPGLDQEYLWMEGFMQLFERHEVG